MEQGLKSKANYIMYKGGEIMCINQFLAKLTSCALHGLRNPIKTNYSGQVKQPEHFVADYRPGRSY